MNDIDEKRYHKYQEGDIVMFRNTLYSQLDKRECVVIRCHDDIYDDNDITYGVRFIDSALRGFPIMMAHEHELFTIKISI